MPHDLVCCHGVPSLVIAAGTGGRILMFRGETYQPYEVASPTRATLRGVWVQSPQSAWAVGDDGVVIHWNGHEWTRVPVASHDHLTCIWGHPAEGIWIGATRHLLHHSPDGRNAVIVESDAGTIRSIWGTGPGDMWFLGAGRSLMHWTGDRCAGELLPGDDDEEWNCVTGGAPDEHVYVVGIMGLVMEWTGEQWMEFDSETSDLLMGACSVGPSLYVVTDMGLVRQWNGQRWRTVAFSAFGALHACCYVDGVLWACGDRGVIIRHQPEEGGAE